MESTPNYQLIKGTETQYTIQTSINTSPPIDVTVTQYSDSNTMLICLTDCNVLSQWIVHENNNVDIRFGKKNTQDPFPTALTRQLKSVFDTVDTLIVAVGVKEPSVIKLRQIITELQVTMKAALMEIKKKAPKSSY
ncbi:Proteasome assembly chaperone 3 [Entamoeba marina]